MLSTLHRYIFQELIKVFIPATIAMTLILSLSSLLEPIQEFGINPTQAMSLLLYLIPITLTFILPITALFSAALTYGRLASDNEIDACKTSGISPFSIISPGIMLAILVAIINLILSFHVMPSFIYQAEELIRTDAKQILFRNLQRKGFYRLPPDNHYIIYADHVYPEQNLLAGVVVVDSKPGYIRKIIAADSVNVSFQVTNNRNEVNITAQNTLQIGLESDIWFEMKLFSIKLPFGSIFSDKIDFKTINEIKNIKSNLMSFVPINTRARDTAAQYINELLYQDIQKTIAAGQAYEITGEPNSIRFVADGCTLGQEKQIKLTDNIELTEYNRRSQKILRTLQCEKASLYVVGDEFNPTLLMDIINAHDMESQDIIMIRPVIRNLQLPLGIQRRLNRNLLLSNLTEESITMSLKAGPSEHLQKLITNLDWMRRKTLADIKAEFHWRLVLGLGCIPMIIIGLALGIIQKGGHMLGAFASAFVPALILVVAIVSGKQITENLESHAVSGPAIMWTGLVLLLGLMIILFRKLIRH